MKARITIGKGNIAKETDKAVCLDYDTHSVWLPKSQIEIEFPEDAPMIGMGYITMPIWLARAKGFWGFDCFGEPVCELVE